jgi:hypothetical protein
MKSKFISPSDIFKKKHSGWSGHKCSTCGKEITNAALGFSMRFYNRPLCKQCQSLDEYAKKKEENIDPENKGVKSLLDE